jgi:hypothetical protein
MTHLQTLKVLVSALSKMDVVIEAALVAADAEEEEDEALDGSCCIVL